MNCPKWANAPRIVETKDGEYTIQVDTEPNVKIPKNWRQQLIRYGRYYLEEHLGYKIEKDASRK